MVIRMLSRTLGLSTGGVGLRSGVGLTTRVGVPRPRRRCGLRGSRCRCRPGRRAARHEAARLVGSG